MLISWFLDTAMLFFGIYEYANQIVPWYTSKYYCITIWYMTHGNATGFLVWFWPQTRKKKKSHTQLTELTRLKFPHNASHITCPSVSVWCIIHVAWVQMHCMEGNVKRWARWCNIKLTHTQRDANGMLNKPGSWIIEPFGLLWLTLLACVPSGPNLCSHRNGFHRSLIPSRQPGVNSAAPVIH